jgi:hypothetical protein
VILSVMALMAATGLFFALATTGFRRANDHRGTKETFTPPAQLAGLGYLPKDVSLIAGFDVAQWCSATDRRTMLERLQVPAAQINLNNLGRTTGLMVEEIDHVVLGVHADAKALPQVTLVVQTRQPYDLNHVLMALSAEPASVKDRKGVYGFKQSLILQPGFWCADDHTLIFTLNVKDLEAVPQGPIPGAIRFSEPIRTRLENDLEQDALIWVVGYATNWGEIGESFLNKLKAALPLVGSSRPPPLLITLANLKEKDKQRLKTLQGFAVGLEPREVGLLATARLNCSDDNAAVELEQYLTPVNRQGEVIEDAVHSVKGRTVYLEFPILRRK